MRTVMLSKWAGNFAGKFLLVAAMGVIGLMVYWQHKLLTLEEQQKYIGAKLGIVTKTNANNGGSSGRLGSSGVGGGADGGTFGAINAYDSIDGSPNDDSPDLSVIIYNRIPKTGSTSLMGIAYELCSKNLFSVIHLNTTKNSHVLTPADQIRFAQNISNWMERRPAIYHGHLGYLDFDSLGVNLRPLYINVVRDPLERLISYYYFLRFGDNFRPEVVRKRKGNKETFDECVTRGGTDCDPVNLWMQIPFFCGHHSACWEPGNTWALQQAKANLAKSYFLVGTTENILEFVTLLEASLPRFFRGALKLFNSDGKSHLRKTFGKQLPSKDTIKAIHKSKIWQMEQDFYMFAKKNFNSIKKRALPTDGSTFIPQQFRFEKIRPGLR
ncbi:heparan sulfate 2-O-sulfotransferase 1 isoform X2 [Folsomia candida]|uniref:heparan sulfate 2-O-sulfotransferase 1 isoform X1 n=1 Tax=Folsomia candida TaxID=158441 RepID=UPI000B8F9577|nr:heparan sulfate 2-O-sulfotransferase 1 isoform X1 [Folsomia candida]XP_035704813.1 heparan sulfate 2-O-sulfotransferase 1 isoform X1 [Folsomia candida]XP_035704814.1 heparan sulfate 2-O-sulfotransferase 1 isoform X1 [Folsomia candida]XP_035704815.1 heparan sulfate 2-O-sulfotransferase 1 isoform X2 [Folsomia candida]